MKCIPYSGLDINYNGVISLCTSDSVFSKVGFGNFLIFEFIVCLIFECLIFEIIVFFICLPFIDISAYIQIKY